MPFGKYSIQTKTIEGKHPSDFLCDDDIMATYRLPATDVFYECLWHRCQIWSGLELVKLQTPEEHHGINLQILGQKTMCLRMLGSRRLWQFNWQLAAFRLGRSYVNLTKVGSTSRCLGQLLCGFPRFRDSAWLDGKQWLAWNGVFRFG